MSDGARGYAQAYATGDGAATSAVRRYCNNDRVIHLMDSGGSAVAAFGWDGTTGADGFTIQTITTPSATYTIYYEAFGGFDNAYLDVAQLPAATGSFSRTAAGFQPDAILWASVMVGTLNSATAAGRYSEGWSLSAGTQYAVGLFGANGATSDYTGSSSATDRIFYVANTAGTAQLAEAEITSHNSDGFTANRITGTGTQYYAALHLKGGTWVAGTTTAQAATGTFNVTTTGVNPAYVALMASNITTASRTTPFEGTGGNISLGAASATTERYAITVHSYNAEALGTSDEFQRGDAGKLWAHYDRTGANTLTATGEIDLSAFGTEQFTLDQTDADPTAVLIGWLAMGAAAGGGGTPVPVFLHHLRQQGIS
jgi:hypothetical protein